MISFIQKNLNKAHYHKVLSEYIPIHSIDYIIELLEKNPIHLKITRERLTKHGDFRVFGKAKPQITVNYNLNQYAFLITLVHELAHFVNFSKNKKNVEPHGIEWKTEFKYLMLPLLRPDVFPDDLLSVLAKHMKNPKASSSADPQLVKVLRQYDPQTTEKTYLHQLTIGTIFELNTKRFILGELRRTRYLCEEVRTKKQYLVSANAAVTLV